MSIMKKCCGLCPYSRLNTLFLHPERAAEFAYSASNPCSDFVCHKTGVLDEDDEGSAGIVRGQKSLTCAGFYAMQHLLNYPDKDSKIEINPEDHFDDVYEMIEHHEEHYQQN
jgi:hypothetical protein